MSAHAESAAYCRKRADEALGIGTESNEAQVWATLALGHELALLREEVTVQGRNSRQALTDIWRALVARLPRS